MYEGLCNVVQCPSGPLPKTVVDFWRLVWQERSPTIVMITNLVEGTKIKCQQYWPEGGAQEFGPFLVTITDQQILADYAVRRLLVQVGLFYQHLCVFNTYTYSLS